MFTGIIEEIGLIKSINKSADGATIAISCNKILDDITIGDSIAVDGACQTAVAFDNTTFKVEASPETLNLTTLYDFYPGKYVNLERAMKANGRFGGHIVSGHVDSTGTFIKKEKQGISYLYYFQAPQTVLNYIIHKGSICINGISLTIASLQNDIFSIAVIPQTIKDTNLQYLKPKDKVNLESDVFAKYVEKFMINYNNNANPQKADITLDYLAEHGFIN